jgi:hypothetical protein
MLVSIALLLAFALPALVGGKIPLVDGVIGGVGSSDHDAGKYEASEEATTANAPARTPGKLRVVENSGVCGTCILFVGRPPSYSPFL